MRTASIIPPNFAITLTARSFTARFPLLSKFPEGEYNPLIGLTYVQVARVGLGHQKSQSGGTGLPPAEAEMTPYHRFASLVPVPEKESSFYEGIDIR